MPTKSRPEWGAYHAGNEVITMVAARLHTYRGSPMVRPCHPGVRAPIKDGDTAVHRYPQGRPSTETRASTVNTVFFAGEQ